MPHMCKLKQRSPGGRVVVHPRKGLPVLHSCPEEEEEHDLFTSFCLQEHCLYLQGQCSWQLQLCPPVSRLHMTCFLTCIGLTLLFL